MQSELNQHHEFGIAWPSYVDFLTSFIFVLLLLVGALLYLASGDIEEQEFRLRMTAYSEQLKAKGIANYVEGTKQIISLKNKVVIPTGHADLTSVN